MPDQRPEGVSDDEWQAILAHRRDSQPKRKGTGKYTDPDTGISYEFEMTAEETAKLASKALKGLLDPDPEPGPDDGKKKPAVLKDYFGKSKTG